MRLQGRVLKLKIRVVREEENKKGKRELEN